MSDELSNEWKKKAVDGTQFTENDLDSEIEKLHVLSFRLDSRGENVVSSINGTIVFIDRWYSGEKVKVGDIWLCYVKRSGNVYHAMPMKKLTLNIIMGLSTDIRESIVDALWSTNKKDYERLFEERYKAEVQTKAVEQAEKESHQIISRMQAHIDTLTQQVKQMNYLLSNAADYDEIVLSSDPISEGVPDTGNIQQQTFPDGSIGSMMQHPFRPEKTIPRVERISEDTLYSDGFVDGRYKVFISPDSRVLILTPSVSGMAICSKRRIILKGLGELSPYSDRKNLVADMIQGRTIRVFL